MVFLSLRAFCKALMIYCVLVLRSIYFRSSAWPSLPGLWFHSSLFALQWRQVTHASWMGWALRVNKPPHQVVVRASTFGLYQQLAWNLFTGWLQWDISHIFFRCWNVGFLAGVKQSGVHHLSGTSHHGLRCWALTRVTESSLGEWDPLAVGKWWLLCLAWEARSSCAMVVAVSRPLVEVIPYIPWPLACPVALALVNSRHLCYCHQPEIWALRRNSGSQEPCTYGSENVFRGCE